MQSPERVSTFLIKSLVYDKSASICKFDVVDHFVDLRVLLGVALSVLFSSNSPNVSSSMISCRGAREFMRAVIFSVFSGKSKNL